MALGCGRSNASAGTLRSHFIFWKTKQTNKIVFLPHDIAAGEMMAAQEMGC
jgi:hypothetical protein